MRGLRGKCRLGTDSTIGLWVSMLHSVLAIDLINFFQAWAWPLYSRFEQGAHVLADVYLFHLQASSAKRAALWLALLNVTEKAARLVGWSARSGMRVGGGSRHPQLRCIHSTESYQAWSGALLRRLQAVGLAANSSGGASSGGGSLGWLGRKPPKGSQDRHVLKRARSILAQSALETNYDAGAQTKTGKAFTNLPGLDPGVDWLYCYVPCEAMLGTEGWKGL